MNSFIIILIVFLSSFLGTIAGLYLVLFKLKPRAEKDDGDAKDDLFPSLLGSKKGRVVRTSDEFYEALSREKKKPEEIS